MTILQPNSRYQINSGIIVLVALAMVVVSLNIYFYSSIVNMRHRLTKDGKDLQAAQVANADYKNDLYKTLDLGNLKEFSGKSNLVKETKPSYLEVGISVAASGNH